MYILMFNISPEALDSPNFDFSSADFKAILIFPQIDCELTRFAAKGNMWWPSVPRAYHLCEILRRSAP